MQLDTAPSHTRNKDPRFSVPAPHYTWEENSGDLIPNPVALATRQHSPAPPELGREPRVLASKALLYSFAFLPGERLLSHTAVRPTPWQLLQDQLGVMQFLWGLGAPLWELLEAERLEHLLGASEQFAGSGLQTPAAFHTPEVAAF